MKKEDGYTLLEMLISLTLFFMIMSFVPVIIKMTQDYQKTAVSLSTQEWDLFLQQLTFELREGEQVKTGYQKVSFMNSYDQTITYEKYGKNIRRRVNGTGHEILLQNIANVEFTRVPKGLFIQVQDLEQRTYAERVSLFHSDGGGGDS
jgi:competence protein ComGF